MRLCVQRAMALLVLFSLGADKGPNLFNDSVPASPPAAPKDEPRPNLFNKAAPISPGWAMTPDPLPPTTRPALTAPAVKPYSVKVDGDVLPGDPACPTLILTRSDAWSMWDTRTGKQTREVRARFPLSGALVSPDGTLVAGTSDSKVEIWSLKSGSRLASVPPAGKQAADGLKPVPRLFTQQNHLLVSYDGGFNKPSDIAIVDSASGAEIRRFTIPFAPTSIAVSPGGSFAIIAIEHFATPRTIIYNLNTGEACGTLPYEGAQNVGFSPDGKMCAVFTNNFFHPHLAVYTTANGEKSADATPDTCRDVDAKTSSIQFAPDGKTLLFQNMVLDAGSLKQLFKTVAEPRAVKRSRWLDGDHVAVLSDQGMNRQLEAVAVDRDLLARAVQTVASGGNAGDAVLSPLTPIKTDGAPTINIADAPAGWNVTPTALRPTGGFSAAIALKEAPPAADNAANPSQPVGLFFTSAETHAVIVERAAVAKDVFDRDPRYAASPFHRADTRIDRYDLASGAGAASVVVGPLLSVLDVSPTGKALVLHGGEGIDRLEIWTEEKGTYKRVLAAAPFGPAKSVIGKQLRDVPDEHRVEWAACIDDSHVLVMSSGHELILLNVADKTVAWRGMLEKSFAETQAPPAISPDRKLAAASFSHSIVVFDPATGKGLSAVHTESTDPASQLKFSPDGKRLVALFAESDYLQLVLFDLATGKTTASFPVPVSGDDSGAEAAFASDGYLLLGNGDLVSFDKKAIVYHYEMPGAGGGRGGRGASESLGRGSVQPYTRTFYAVATSATGGRGPNQQRSWSIANAELPHPAAVQATKAINGEDLFAVHPGMDVQLALDVVGDNQYLEQQRASWISRLKSRGLTVVDKAPLQLHVHNFVITGKPEIFQVRGGGRGSEYTVTPQAAGYDITLSQDSKTLWHIDNKSEQARSFPVETIEHRQGESIQQAADRAHPDMKQSSIIVPPPAYVYKWGATPSARLGVGGLVDGPPTARP